MYIHHHEADHLGRVVEISEGVARHRRLRGPLLGSRQFTLTTPVNALNADGMDGEKMLG
jgi:hypothetical protein